MRQVILNLPDPNEEESPVDYMQFVQSLTEEASLHAAPPRSILPMPAPPSPDSSSPCLQGCPRVMLVHGTGHEVISGFNAVVDDLEDAPDEDDDEGKDEDAEEDAAGSARQD